MKESRVSATVILLSVASVVNASGAAAADDFDETTTVRAIAKTGISDLQTAATTIEGYIRASGGSALAAVRTEIRKGTLARSGGGPSPLETAAKIPGKWRYRQVFAWGDQISYGSDGTNGWVQDTKTVERMDRKQWLDLELLLDVQAPLRLREIYPVMTIKGVEKVGERDGTTISARSRDGIQTELVFDQKTGLLLRAGTMIFGDYRDVGSVKRPFKVQLGENLELQVTEIRHDQSIDDALFDLPICALSLQEPPLYRPEKHVEVSIAAMDACVGEYLDPSNVVLKVSRRGNHLMFKSPRASFELLAQSETDYVRGYSNLEFHFATDAAGNVTELMIVTPNQTTRAQKIK